MRKTLLELIEKTIVLQYELPHTTLGILRSVFSSENDQCFLANDVNAVKEIIYNSIVEYSFNEFDLTQNDYVDLLAIALQNKIKYDSSDKPGTKLKYGFYGEVLLYSILLVLFKAKPLISRGYFYNPLENSETKGYDAYQLIENNGETQLWFGEVKFHANHEGAIKSALKNIDKALSDKYFHRNIIAIQTRKNNLNITGSKVDQIIKAWEKKPTIQIAEEAKKYNIKLVYPILILYQDDTNGYDNNIKKAVDYINTNYTSKKFNLSIPYSLFFILVPLEKVKEIKTDVIKWIESKKPLMS